MLEVIEIVYILFVMIGSFFYITFWVECGFTKGFLTKKIYEETEMNIVGCIIIAILWYIMFPIFLVRLMCMLIYFLFHVGRKE